MIVALVVAAALVAVRSNNHLKNEKGFVIEKGSPNKMHTFQKEERLYNKFMLW